MRSLWRFPFTRPAAMFTLAFLYVPIIVLVVLSFGAEDSIARWSGFSLRWYAEVWDNDTMLRTIRNSLTVAVFAMLFGTAAATMAALALARGTFRGKTIAALLLGLPLLTGQVGVGTALRWWLAGSLAVVQRVGGLF